MGRTSGGVATGGGLASIGFACSVRRGIPRPAPVSLRTPPASARVVGALFDRVGRGGSADCSERGRDGGGTEVD